MEESKASCLVPVFLLLLSVFLETVRIEKSLLEPVPELIDAEERYSLWCCTPPLQVPRRSAVQVSAMGVSALPEPELCPD